MDSGSGLEIARVAVACNNTTQVLKAAAVGKKHYLLGLVVQGAAAGIVTVAGVALGAAATQWNLPFNDAGWMGMNANTDLSFVTAGNWTGFAIIGTKKV
jgi:hypothetical protein